MGSAWWQCAACLRAQEEDICELQLNHCNLYDVPPDVFIYERTLEKLYLDANRIKDLPRPLFQCHELRVLSLSDNEVTTLPPAIASLINLEYLDLSKNSIKELPDSIKECKNLRSIDISVNPIERFPDAITYMVNLQELYINDAYLEYLPSNFGRLSALRTLEVRENNMITLPKSMSRLVNLQRLDIGNNDFTELPEVVGDLINLTELWIDGNDIRRIPVNIEQLYRLNHFDCTMNAIHTVPSEIQGWRDIAIMNFSSNEIYQLPDSICYLKTIVTLKIDDNQLNSLPDDIGQMSNLEELIVTKNFLESLPPSIGLLRKLHCLNADNNYLRSLPPEMGSCTALSLLSLQSNNLTRIPPELGHLHSLRVLNLVNNCIKFLPVSLLNLSNLKALWLSDNQSQPLVPLQQEYNRDEDMMVLSCFMLPQKPREDIEPQIVGPISNSLIGTGRRICFSAEIDSEVPRQLHRAPTPYPKELRNLARHARNLQNQSTYDPKNSHLSSSSDHNTSNNIVEQSHSEELSSKTNKLTIKKEKNSDTREIKFHTSDYLIRTPKIVNYVNKKSEGYTKAATDKVNSEKSPVVDSPVISDEKSSIVKSANLETPKSNEVSLVPPPYHIAAAFSKKAALFQRLNQDEHADSHLNLTTQMKKTSPDSLSINSENHKDFIQGGNDSDTIKENGSIDDSRNHFDTIDSVTQIPNDEEIIYENDRSMKPSRIPILKTKHLENSERIEEWETTKLMNISNIPTSPITGKKYRSPLSMQPKISDRSKRMLNGSIMDSEISFNDSIMNVASLNPVMELDRSMIAKLPCEPVSPGKNSVDNSIRSDTNSGRSTPVSSNSSKLSSNLYMDTRKCRIPVMNDLSTPERRPKFKWMFGPHRNANVLPVQVRKNPGLGFSIAGGVAGAETGIIVTKVNPDGPAQGALRPGDKILEVDGIDLTKSDHNNAVAVLRATGAVVSMMISRHQSL